MRKVFFLVPLFLFITFQYQLEAQQAVDSVKIQLNLLLDHWHKDAALGNHEAYIGAMTPEGVFIGTDATEYWTTTEFSKWCKPYFDKKRTWNFKPVSRNVYLNNDGTNAWFDELLDTQMGLCRGSGSLVKLAGQWKIAQYVLSATIPNDIMKKVTAMKSGADSTQILKEIFDQNGMTGTIVIFDPEKGRYFGYKPALWDSGYLPASTFKIPNSLIGLETGVIDTGYVFRWNGEQRRLPQWNKDLTLREAFKVSCVPCFQEIARKIGPVRMKSNLDKINYTGMDVHPENIDLFWLEGNSRITPRQQVNFVKRLYEEKLSLKKQVMQAVKSIMVIEVTPDYSLSGKTGWAVRNGNNYGWFVGWLETKGKVYFLATLVEPKDQEKVDDFAVARKTVTMDVFRKFSLIPEKNHGKDNPDSFTPGSLRPDDGRFLAAMGRWKASGAKRPAFTGKNGSMYDSLARKCIFTLMNNRQGPSGALKHEGVYPSYLGFTGFWAWDSWKHAYALSAIDPELAKNSIRSMFDFQDSCGMVADCIFIDSTENNYRDTKPPLSAWAVEEIFRQTSDTAFVREMFPRLLKYHQWWYTHRDHDQNGLCEYGATDGTIQAARWESGWDNAVRFDSARMLQNNSHAWSMNQESADLNAYLFTEKESLSELAKAAGEMKQAAKFRLESTTLKKKMYETMWDQKTGFYYDVDIRSKKPVRVLEPNGWIPLWAGIADKEQASMIRNHILNPIEFNTFVPFPTIAANDPGFDPEKGYWRGPVWLDQAWFAIHGLRKYGYVADADSLTVKLLTHCEGLLNPTISVRENYHPLTGKGLNAEHFSWSAAFILMILTEFGTVR
ncbi:MAG: class D beta-lactamase [Bacteroidota bacterium]